MIKNKIKEVPGLLFVTDSLEFMSAAGRRRMLEQPWMTARAQLDREQELVQAMKAAMYDSGSVSLSWGAREVGSPREWRGGARHCSRVMGGESGLETC